MSTHLVTVYILKVRRKNVPKKLRCGRGWWRPSPWPRRRPPNPGAPVPPLVPSAKNRGEEGLVSYTFVYWAVLQSILCSRDQYREERPLIPGNPKRKL